ncbi:conserved protein of unknown function [Thiomonas sp. CB2]|nr:conserved protein of unknown function [Thiomonas sp. CB2]
MWIIPVLVLGLILWMIFRGGHGVSHLRGPGIPRQEFGA